MDYYLNVENSYNRLLREYEQYGSLVVAFDFDNTVYDFHQQGHSYSDVIGLLQQLKQLNCYLIVFSANENTNFIEEYCRKMRIPFDAINQNPPFYQSDGRKIYYNILLDDRAGLRESYETLRKLIQHINS